LPHLYIEHFVDLFEQLLIELGFSRVSLLGVHPNGLELLEALYHPGIVFRLPLKEPALVLQR
jgi:hypothetical protein